MTARSLPRSAIVAAGRAAAPTTTASSLDQSPHRRRRPRTRCYRRGRRRRRRRDHGRPPTLRPAGGRHLWSSDAGTARRGERRRAAGTGHRWLRHQRWRPRHPGGVARDGSVRRCCRWCPAPGSRLAEAVQQVERRDGRWIRTDEASWLAMSNDDRDAVLSALAERRRRRAVSRHARPSNDEGADCVIDAYHRSTGSSGRSRDAATSASLGCSPSASPAPPPTDTRRRRRSIRRSPRSSPSCDGTITFSEVRFGSPGAGRVDPAPVDTGQHRPSTWRPASAAVTAGPLAGWQTFPGEGSLLLSGPTGGTWTLSDRVAVFAWAGRW